MWAGGVFFIFTHLAYAPCEQWAVRVWCIAGFEMPQVELDFVPDLTTRMGERAMWCEAIRLAVADIFRISRDSVDRRSAWGWIFSPWGAACLALVGLDPEPVRDRIRVRARAFVLAREAAPDSVSRFAAARVRELLEGVSDA